MKVYPVGGGVAIEGTVDNGLQVPEREPPAVYQGKFDPRVLYKAFMALHDL